ncbi:MAG: putative bifunctional diguanylate cyclase/phosphodiesterase [Lysobacterales bacterium]
MSQPEPQHGLVLLDQADAIDDTAISLLGDQGLVPRRFTRVSDLCQAIVDHQPEIIVFVPGAPDRSAMDICAQITGCRSSGQDRFVVLCTDPDCEPSQLAALGIDDLFAYPTAWPTLARRLKLMALSNQKTKLGIQSDTGNNLPPLSQTENLSNETAMEAGDQVLLVASHRQRAQRILLNALERQSEGAILMVQIHALSGVFRSFGYSKGAKMLDRFSSLLTACIRAEDDVVALNDMPTDRSMVAQVADADFAVLLSSSDRSVSLDVLGARIRRTVGDHITIDGECIPLVFSFGYAAWPDDGINADEILMAACKSARATTTDSLSAGAMPNQQPQMLASLYDAVAQKNIELAYQPRVAAGSGKILGFEALARWYRNGELVPPDAFIPVAENNGLIGQLGMTVAETAIAQHQRWRQMGLGCVPIAINVSPYQFDDEDFSHRLLEVCRKNRTDPRCIEIEVTESSVLRDESATLSQLKVLRDAGMRVALDDFGTGYSSLSHLQKLELDALKIDRSFISQLSDPTSDPGLVVSIIGIGINLGLSVVAEGVEELDQAEMLHEWGCHELQGYYYSKPVDASQAEVLLTCPRLPAKPIKQAHCRNEECWPPEHSPEPNLETLKPMA